MSVTAAEVLDALGDPTRRSILERLLDGPLPVGVLAERLPVSRPAVSQHLRVLKAAELVTVSTVGTRHVYAIDTAGLDAVRTYFDRFWATALHDFAALAEAAAERSGRASAAAASEPTDPTEENR
ncbi:ArsR/SmtB family transcription factor [Allonocardiopsis opalescens]|uniref:ArsR family transcriptional regulator n=1 Tax=Allonocardiopsis opalescens TaxID=1144618 RepID=A0A2T0Q9P7_9ACTN|nr:metalloregulator ArsR/SmtB family transcription factor [Allonocardiopsis opalescens]PRY00616.1 ArsR family transcriptional regulator [Allonocardiopsis opalescens]